MTEPLIAAPPRDLAWRWVLWRLLLVLPALQLWAILSGGFNPPADSDYNILYVHAEMARAGEPLYWEWPEYGPHYGASGLRFPQDRVFYPPFLTPLLSGLTRFGLEPFTYLWVTLLWMGYWVYAACLGKLSHGRWALAPTIGWGLALFALTGGAAQSAITLGNVDPLLWALFGAALALPLWRGASFMAIALVKLYGVWPIAVAAAVERDRKILVTAGATLVAGTAVSVVFLGPASFLEESLAWFRYMLPVAGQGTFNDYNVSLSFAGLRAARWLGWEYSAGPLGTLPRLYLTGVGIAAPLFTGWLLRRAEARLRDATVLCAAVFCAPLAWNFYSALLLAPLALILARRSGGPIEAATHDGTIHFAYSGQSPTSAKPASIASMKASTIV